MINRFWAALSTMLGLVGLYLVLANAGGASRILTGLGSTLRGVFRTLQGR